MIYHLVILEILTRLEIQARNPYSSNNLSSNHFYILIIVQNCFQNVHRQSSSVIDKQLQLISCTDHKINNRLLRRCRANCCVSDRWSSTTLYKAVFRLFIYLFIYSLVA